MQTFTDKQRELIEKCKNTGYGWAKFARSVEASGKCSIKQEEVLVSMVRRIKDAEQRHKLDYTTRDYDSDISDYEAMSTNDFF